MCLNRTAKFKPTKEGIGYKWIKRSEYNGEGYVTICELYPLEEKKWMKAENTANNERDNGFHIFDRKSEALKSEWREDKSWRKPILVQVEYKNYKVGYGDGVHGDDFRIIVAKKMRILKEIKV